MSMYFTKMELSSGALSKNRQLPRLTAPTLRRRRNPISYLSHSGYTLTVALNLEDGSTVGIASNEKTLMPVHGHFEVVN
jgi:hypothetical protein